MTLTQDVNFENDELYYTLHVLNKKIMLMTTLLNMYVHFSCLISESTLDKYFSGVSTILINIGFSRQVS